MPAVARRDRAPVERFEVIQNSTPGATRSYFPAMRQWAVRGKPEIMLGLQRLELVLGMIKTIEAQRDTIASTETRMEQATQKIQDLSKIKCTEPEFDARMRCRQRARFSRHALKLRLYLKYGSGPRLISRTHPPQRVLCDIAAFPPYYPTR